MRDIVCGVDGCGGFVYVLSRGWCRAHYLRWQRYGDPEAGGPRRPTRYRGALCALSDCDRPAAKRGWCELHYRRWRIHGDPECVLVMSVRPPGSVCAVPGCERPQRGRKWCASHYVRWRETGDPGPAFLSDEVCPVCGGTVDRSKTAGRRFCSKACAYSSVTGRPSWKVLVERDGWACHLCGTDVDPTVPHTAANYPSVDHVIPRSVGGSDDYSNLLLAHKGCNARRGTAGLRLRRSCQERAA